MASAVHRSPEHRSRHKLWKARLSAAGALPCVEPRHHPTCPRLIQAGMPWDLPHDRATGGYREGIAWPACNRAEGARYGNRLRGFRRRLVIRTVGNPSRSW